MLQVWGKAVLAEETCRAPPTAVVVIRPALPVVSGYMWFAAH